MLAVWACLVLVLLGRAVWRVLGPVSGGLTVVSTAIDLNRASVAELQALPGIGPSRAEALVLERIRHGPFAALEDLCRVDGFGPELRERLRPFVCF